MTKVCPVCGGDVRQESRVCPHCWARIGAAEPQTRTSLWRSFLFVSVLAIGALTYIAC